MIARHWLVLTVGISSGSAVCLAFRPAPQLASPTVSRPPRLVLSCPGRIDEPSIGESWFTVDFDRLPGLPGSIKTMQVHWCDIGGGGNSWSILFGQGSAQPVACLDTSLGLHSASVSYTKPAGLQLVRLSGANYCSPASGGLVWGVVLELD